MATQKQIEYINFLLDKHDNNGTLTDVMHDINPDYSEDEDFSDWIKRQTIGKASEIIDDLKNSLRD
jgi:hypothetical protein